jgi:hypothetical protein
VAAFDVQAAVLVLLEAVQVLALVDDLHGLVLGHAALGHDLRDGLREGVFLGDAQLGLEPARRDVRVTGGAAHDGLDLEPPGELERVDQGVVLAEDVLRGVGVRVGHRVPLVAPGCPAGWRGPGRYVVEQDTGHAGCQAACLAGSSREPEST